MVIMLAVMIQRWHDMGVVWLFKDADSDFFYLFCEGLALVPLHINLDDDDLSWRWIFTFWIWSWSTRWSLASMSVDVWYNEILKRKSSTSASMVLKTSAVVTDTAGGPITSWAKMRSIIIFNQGSAWIVFNEYTYTMCATFNQKNH